QAAIDQFNATLPARPLFRRASKDLAEECEALVRDCFGQHSGIGFDHVEGEPVFPGIKRGGGDEGCFGGERSWLPNDEALLLAQSGAAEILGPIEAGSLFREILRRPRIVRLVDVLAVRQAEM